MAFCSKCGNELNENANFCSNCGIEIKENNKKQREILFEGKIHKCPNCGEIINGFEIKCSACGFELRNSEVSNNIEDFTNKLSNIKSEEDSVKLIRNFPIPNNKEDILEFMILAASNITGEKSRNVFEAWLAKFEQCYQKSKILFENDSFLNNIQKIYEETNVKIEKEKNIHNAMDLKKWLDKIMLNPIFGVVTIFVLAYAFIRLFKGQFAGIDIIFDTIILTITYKLTNKKSKD